MSLRDEMNAPPDEEGSAAVTPTFGAMLADAQSELIDAAVEFDRLIAWAAAGRARVIDQAREISEFSAPHQAPTAFIWDARLGARRVFETELACALRLPEPSVQRLVGESRALMHGLPETRGALARGEISYRHAQTMFDQVGSLPAGTWASFEVAVLPAAKALTVAKFERAARRARELAHPESITVRHRTSFRDRNLTLSPARDGMAYLVAYMSAVDAHAAYDRLSTMALSLQGPDEGRTLTQLRVDVFGDLLCCGLTRTGLGEGIRARVQVTVPVLTLLGRSEEPGSLEGYGPIDPDTARELAGHAPSFTRLLTHPETGCVLSVGRDRYKVPKDLRTWLSVRDETCRFSGCNRAAIRCDIDHTLDWQYGGPTDHDNLAHLCPFHHALKHATAWTVKQVGRGALDWTSPRGRTYRTEPATWIRPYPVDPVKPPF